MSRKHAHRADNQPVTRRYVRSVVQRARDEILSAVVNGYQPWPRDEQIMHGLEPVSPERIERAVNGHGPPSLPWRTCQNCGARWSGSGLNHPGCLHPLGIYAGPPELATLREVDLATALALREMVG
jgi:hypothetical protein